MRYILMAIYILCYLSLVAGWGLWVYNSTIENQLHLKLFIVAFNLAALFVITYFVWKGFETFFDLD